MFLCIELVAKYASKRGVRWWRKKESENCSKSSWNCFPSNLGGTPAMLPQLTDSMVQVVSLLRSL